MKYALAILAGIAAIALSEFASAQTKHEMKVAYFIGDQHPVGAWFVRWSDGIEKASGGRIAVKRFPGAQMGPAPGYYDMARTGQSEVAFFIHGGTPGRFPITELINLPYLIGSGDIGAKVLNDPEMRTKYLDGEHKGIKALVYFTVQPGQVMTTKKPIRTLEDFKGMRIRFSSPTIREFIAALGGTPVGVSPTEIAEALQKGTVDGAFIDYGGAGIAFKLGGIVKHVSEMYSFVTSFGVAMNPDFYNKLPPDLKKVIDDSMIGQAKELADGIDSIDAPGKKLIVEGGANAFRLSPEEDAKFRKAGAEVAEVKVKELEAKGLPARGAYTLMKSLADQHSKTSRNFWN